MSPSSHPSPFFPLCHMHIHDTFHRFNCRNNPTLLELESLWTEPIGNECFCEEVVLIDGGRRGCFSLSIGALEVSTTMSLY